MLLESVLSKFAATGVAAKAAAGGAAVVLAASAAGVADALPEPAQDAFDGVVSVDAEIEPAGDVEDANENSEFGQSVADDATGGAEGDEPGVDGCEIAREASGRDLTDCGDDTADENGESDAMEGFGDDVSEDAQDGGVDGAEISQEARDSNPGEAGEGADNAPADAGPEGTPGAAAVDANRATDQG